ncbi:MAG: DUF357 domain-containing protein [Candidatus Aenigmarchaeota archaeon]|nr:DUF357 domain-containing protein [Candidatus Aenigmarchaeota archaeon]
MDPTQKALLAETKKWLEKLESKKLVPVKDSKEVKEQLENVQAYVSDCKHFLEKKDFVRAFEAVIYAWGIAETLERMGLLRE